MASGYTQFFTNFSIHSVLFEKPLFKWSREGKDRVHYQIRDGLDQHGRVYLSQTIAAQGFGAALYLDQVNMILQRPRILKFDDVDFGLLENIELRIPASEYEQPFETVIIELPKEYQISNTQEEKVYPMFVSSTWRKDLGMLSLHIFLSSHDVYGCIIGGPEFDLETQLIGCRDTFIGSLPISDEERDSCARILRACLNASLFATTVNLKSAPENPRYYERLNFAFPHTDKWRRFKAHPFIYTSSDRVVEKTGNFTERSARGWIVSPHWRKAHWRMQRCGIGLTETRLVLIAAILVNGDRL